jgi:hypothetical protein
VERVAEFAITQVSFNPAGTYLACSSVANSISIVTLDESPGQPHWLRLWVVENWLIILGILLLLWPIYNSFNL